MAHVDQEEVEIFAQSENCPNLIKQEFEASKLINPGPGDNTSQPPEEQGGGEEEDPLLIRPEDEVGGFIQDDWMGVLHPLEGQEEQELPTDLDYDDVNEDQSEVLNKIPENDTS